MCLIGVGTVQSTIGSWSNAVSLDVAAGLLSWSEAGKVMSYFIPFLPRTVVAIAMAILGLWQFRREQWLTPRFALAAYATYMASHVISYLLIALEAAGPSCLARAPSFNTAIPALVAI